MDSALRLNGRTIASVVVVSAGAGAAILLIRKSMPALRRFWWRSASSDAESDAASQKTRIRQRQPAQSVSDDVICCIEYGCLMLLHGGYALTGAKR